jgi:hypothetical protein
MTTKNYEITILGRSASAKVEDQTNAPLSLYPFHYYVGSIPELVSQRQSYF